jgi:hypothetical protein
MAPATLPVAARCWATSGCAYRVRVMIGAGVTEHALYVADARRVLDRQCGRRAPQGVEPARGNAGRLHRCPEPFGRRAVPLAPAGRAGPQWRRRRAPVYEQCECGDDLAGEADAAPRRDATLRVRLHDLAGTGDLHDDPLYVQEALLGIDVANVQAEQFTESEAGRCRSPRAGFSTAASGAGPDAASVAAGIRMAQYARVLLEDC